MMRNKIILECICGNIFKIYPYRIKEAKFCSRTCSSKYRAFKKGYKSIKGSIAKIGINNPMFGKNPNEKQLESLRLGRVKTKTKEELRWNKTKCELRRNSKKKYNGGKHTFKDWENLKKEYNYICPCCGLKEPKIKLTEDHIIPITKDGTDDIGNIQPLCFRCNMLKKIKIIKYEKILSIN